MVILIVLIIKTLIVMIILLMIINTEKLEVLEHYLKSLIAIIRNQ